MTATNPDDTTQLTLRLRRAAAALATGDEDAQLAAEFIRAILSGSSLEETFGVVPGPGQRSVSTRFRIEARDQLLRDAAALFFPDLPVAAQAEELHHALKRYFASAWMRERSEEACPVRHHGKIQAACWQILRSREAVLSNERIRKIIGREP
jgi:hypothetical protein